MSWCGGRVCCKIYRDKKFCRKSEHAENHVPCDCRHARFRCEVEPCGIEDHCGEHAIMRKAAVRSDHDAPL